MTEPLDLDALKREIYAVSEPWSTIRCYCKPLIAELEAARAERDKDRARAKLSRVSAEISEARAQRAEELSAQAYDHNVSLVGRLADAVARADRAEAGLVEANDRIENMRQGIEEWGTRAERAEAELSRFKAFEYADCEATKNRFAAAIARVEALAEALAKAPTGSDIAWGIREVLRGDG